MIDVNESASTATVDGRVTRIETRQRNARNETDGSARRRHTDGDRFRQEIVAVEIKETSVWFLISRQQIANWPVILDASHGHLTGNGGRGS